MSCCLAFEVAGVAGLGGLLGFAGPLGYGKAGVPDLDILRLSFER